MRGIEQLVKEGQAAAEDARHWTERRAEGLGCKHLGVLWEREDEQCALWLASIDGHAGAWLSMALVDDDVIDADGASVLR